MSLPPLEIIDRDEANARRMAFRAKISAQAAALEARRAPGASHASAPEAMPAETDPPRQQPSSFAELLAMRQEAARALENLDNQIGTIEQDRAHPSPRDIQLAVAKRYGITRNDLISARRTANIVLPRLIACYLCKELTPFSLPALGRFFGGRDHTTILHAVRKIAHLRGTDPQIAAEVQELLKIILGEAAQ